MIDEIKHIIKAIDRNATSLGDNPALPPEDEDKILARLVTEHFKELSSKVDEAWPEKKELLDDSELSTVLTSIKKDENKSHVALEELLSRFLVEEFGLDDANLEFDLKLVDRVDCSNCRMYPEQTSDYTFEDIDDMKGVTAEVYKRRFLNALITGAAMSYASRINKYIPDIEKINSDLPALYTKLMLLNDILLFTNKAVGPGENDGSDGGKVDVCMGGENDVVRIEAEALVLPILLFESVKGLFELSIAHGLPKERDKANYIISKADFKFAEVWDQRLGIVIWKKFGLALDRVSFSDERVGICHLLMEISMLPTNEFNKLMSNILAETKYGMSRLDEICNSIQEKKEHDDFDAHITDMEMSVDRVGDGDFYGDENADELLINDSCE